MIATVDPLVYALHVRLAVGRMSVSNLAADSTSDDEAKVRTVVAQGARSVDALHQRASLSGSEDRLRRGSRVIADQAERNRHDAETAILQDTANDERGPAKIDRFWQSNLVGAALLGVGLLLAPLLIASLFADGLRPPTEILATLLAGIVAFVAGDWVGRGRRGRHIYLGVGVVLTATIFAVLFAAAGSHPVLAIALAVLTTAFAGGLGYLVGRGRVLGPIARMEERERALAFEKARTQESLETSTGTADLHRTNEVAPLTATVGQLAARTLQAVEELLDQLSSSGRPVDTNHLRSVASSLVASWPRIPTDMES